MHHVFFIPNQPAFEALWGVLGQGYTGEEYQSVVELARELLRELAGICENRPSHVHEGLQKCARDHVDARGDYPEWDDRPCALCGYDPLSTEVIEARQRTAERRRRDQERWSAEARRKRRKPRDLVEPVMVDRWLSEMRRTASGDIAAALAARGLGCGVYVLLNDSDEILYVGVGKNVDGRLRSHANDYVKREAGWTKWFYWKFVHYDDACEMEAILIATLNPALNVAGRSDVA